MLRVWPRKYDNPIGYGNHLRKVHDLIAPEKKCWGCEETKPIEQFPRARTGSSRRCGTYSTPWS